MESSLKEERGTKESPRCRVPVQFFHQNLGVVAKWLKAPDCRSGHHRFESVLSRQFYVKMVRPLIFEATTTFSES